MQKLITIDNFTIRFLRWITLALPYRIPSNCDI